MTAFQRRSPHSKLSQMYPFSYLKPITSASKIRYLNPKLPRSGVKQDMHVHTPLLFSEALSALAGTKIWLKMDALQPTGSFKIRGIGHACKVYAEQGCTGFVSSSGGNAGISAAYAGRELGLPVQVFVPETTTALAIQQIQQYQAEVIVTGASWQEANEAAQGALTDELAFIHPFDDPLLWQGHATLVDEIIADDVRPDAVITVAGGGGLYCGIAQGLKRTGLDATEIYVAETSGADSFAKALLAGELVTLPAITSVATSLGARTVCAEALALAQSSNTISVVISDDEAVQACRQFLDDHRILVEPACGAALALIYQAHVDLSKHDCVAIEICGGTTTNLASLASHPGWLHRSTANTQRSSITS